MYALYPSDGDKLKTPENARLFRKKTINMFCKTCFSCFSCFLLFSYLKNERKIFRIFELFAQISRQIIRKACAPREP